MYLVKVYVTYKDSILDPKGEAIKSAIHRLGHEEVTDVRLGKYFEIKVTTASENLDEMINKICDELLANVNMESYRYDILEVTK